MALDEHPAVRDLPRLLEQGLSRQVIQTLIEMLPVGVAIWDSQRRLFQRNELCVRMMNIPPELGRIGTTMWEHALFWAKRGAYGPGDPERLADERTIQIYAIKNRRAELRFGNRFIEHSMRVLEDDTALSIYLDVSEQRLLTERLAHLATHDSLTGLANRVHFFDRLRHRLARADRQTWPPFAVLYLDLDGFKAVNDRHGHAVGDRVLIAAARAFEGAIRSADLVARLGGDEFTILIDSIESIDGVKALAERIVAQIPIAAAEIVPDQPVGVSIGIAMGGDSTLSPDSLLTIADDALYNAKRLGKGRFVIAGYGGSATT